MSSLNGVADKCQHAAATRALLLPASENRVSLADEDHKRKQQKLHHSEESSDDESTDDEDGSPLTDENEIALITDCEQASRFEKGGQCRRGHAYTCHFAQPQC
jgi:hypothetical protein